MYEYRAVCESPALVHDGDTITVTVDQGLKEFRVMHIRLAGINAPELATDAGKAARLHLLNLIYGAIVMPPIGTGTTVPVALVVRTLKDQADKYGERWEGRIWREADGMWGPDNQFITTAPSVNQQMVADGFAVVYP